MNLNKNSKDLKSFCENRDAFDRVRRTIEIYNK